MRRTRPATRGSAPRPLATTWSTGRLDAGRAGRLVARQAARGRGRGLLPRARRASSAAGSRRDPPRRRGPRDPDARTSSSRSARSRGCRRCPASTASGSGRTARRRSPGSCRRASLVARRRPDRLRAVPGLRPRSACPVTIVQSGDRLMPTEHPRNLAGGRRAPPPRRAWTCGSACARPAARAGAGLDGADVIDLDDGTTAEGHAILLAVGRTFPLDDLGLEHYGDRHQRAPGVPARRAAADRGRAVGHRRPGRPGAPHPPGPLPGRARGPDGDGPRGPRPTTGRSLGRPTPIPRPPRSG